MCLAVLERGHGRMKDMHRFPALSSDDSRQCTRCGFDIGLCVGQAKTRFAALARGGRQHLVASDTSK